MAHEHAMASAFHGCKSVLECHSCKLMAMIQDENISCKKSQGQL